MLYSWPQRLISCFFLFLFLPPFLHPSLLASLSSSTKFTVLDWSAHLFPHWCLMTYGPVVQSLEAYQESLDINVFVSALTFCSRQYSSLGSHAASCAVLHFPPTHYERNTYCNCRGSWITNQSLGNPQVNKGVYQPSKLFLKNVISLMNNIRLIELYTQEGG